MHVFIFLVKEKGKKHQPYFQFFFFNSERLWHKRVVDYSLSLS